LVSYRHPAKTAPILSSEGANFFNMNTPGTVLITSLGVERMSLID
jgi:hypothetical protein